MWRCGAGKVLCQYEAGPGLHTVDGSITLIYDIDHGFRNHRHSSDMGLIS